MSDTKRARTDAPRIRHLVTVVQENAGTLSIGLWKLTRRQAAILRQAHGSAMGSPQSTRAMAMLGLLAYDEDDTNLDNYAEVRDGMANRVDPSYVANVEDEGWPLYPVLCYRFWG